MICRETWNITTGFLLSNHDGFCLDISNSILHVFNSKHCFSASWILMFCHLHVFFFYFWSEEKKWHMFFWPWFSDLFRDVSFLVLGALRVRVSGLSNLEKTTEWARCEFVEIGFFWRKKRTYPVKTSGWRTILSFLQCGTCDFAGWNMVLRRWW